MRSAQIGETTWFGCEHDDEGPGLMASISDSIPSGDATGTRVLPEGPPASSRFRRRVRVGASLRELWRARELVRTLVERELRARYKQAVLGFAWAIVTPFVMMVVFPLFFQRVVKVDTHGAPYPLFSYLGLLPWTFFSSSVSQGGTSLLTNNQLLNKVYCPREVFPLASVGVAGVDMLIAVAPLAVLFILTTYAPSPSSIWVPVLLLVQMSFTLGVVLFISVLIIYMRDVRHALPIALQLGLFATPVAYGMEVIPASLRVAYSALNPLAPVIDGYRRTVLYGLPPDWHLLVPAMIASALWLIFGYAAFKRLETGIADVA